MRDAARAVSVGDYSILGESMWHALGELARDYLAYVAFGCVVMVGFMAWMPLQQRWRHAGRPSVMAMAARGWRAVQRR